MNVFELRERLVHDYSSYIQSFLSVREGRVRELVDRVLGTTWWEQDDATRALARHLGFKRTGPNIDDAVRSAMNGLIRQGRVERDGSRIRKVQ